MRVSVHGFGTCCSGTIDRKETKETMDKILDINEAAAMVGLTPNALRMRAQRGTVPHETVGTGKYRKLYVFREDYLRAWAETMRRYDLTKRLDRALCH